NDDLNNNGVADYLEASVSLTDREVEEIQLNEKSSIFKIFPNPTSDELYISFEDVSNVKNVTIYDMNGKSLLTISKDELALKKNINLKRLLTAGLYIVKADLGENSVVKKLYVK